MADILLTSLEPSTCYLLQVRATNATEVSEWSQTVSFKTIGDAVAPGAITGLNWAPDSTAFKATWNAVTTNADGTPLLDFKDYKVVVYSQVDTSVRATFYVTEPAFTLTFEANRAAFGAPRPVLTIEVTARDTTDNESAKVTATAVNPAPRAPSNFTGTGGQDSIVLSWDRLPDTDLDYYEVYYATSPTDGGTSVYRGKSNVYVHQSVAYNTDHYFKVRAVDVFGTAGPFTSLSGPYKPRQTMFKRDRFPLSGTFSSPPTTLTLVYTPLFDSEHVYLNGIEQDKDLDYTVSGRTITILSTMGVLAGDKIDVKYAYLPSEPTIITDPVPEGLNVPYGSDGWRYANIIGGEPTIAAIDYDDSNWATGKAVLYNTGMEALYDYTQPFNDGATGTPGSRMGLGTNVGNPQPFHSFIEGEFWVRRWFPPGEQIRAIYDINNYATFYIDGELVGNRNPGRKCGGLLGNDIIGVTKTEPWLLAVHVYAANGQTPAACDFQVTGRPGGWFESSSIGANVGPTMPTDARAGDLGIIFIAADTAKTVTLNGWFQHANTSVTHAADSGTKTYKHYVLSKTLVGSDTMPSISVSGSNVNVSRTLVYAGTASVSGVTTQTTSDALTAPAPAGIGGDTAVRSWMALSDEGTIFPPTNRDGFMFISPGYFENIDDIGNADVDLTLFIEKDLSAVPATATTATGAAGWVAHTVTVNTGASSSDPGSDPEPPPPPPPSPGPIVSGTPYLARYGATNQWTAWFDLENWGTPTSVELSAQFYDGATLGDAWATDPAPAGSPYSSTIWTGGQIRPAYGSGFPAGLKLYILGNNADIDAAWPGWRTSSSYNGGVIFDSTTNISTGHTTAPPSTYDGNIAPTGSGGGSGGGTPSATKLHIHHGWDMANPSQIAAHASLIDSRPFDGITVYLPTLSDNTFYGGATITQAQYASALSAMPTLTNVTHNFLVVRTMHAIDWYNDTAFTTIANNFTNLANALEAHGQFDGIFFDVEWYGSGTYPWGYGTGSTPWTYSATSGATPGKLPADANAKVGSRGEQIANAVAAAWSNCAIMSTYGPWVGETKTVQSAYGGWSSFGYNDTAYANELMGSFTGGLAAGSAKYVDGGEVYQAHTTAEYLKAYNWQKTGLAASGSIVVRNPSTYAADVSVGYGVYDRDFRVSGWPTATAAQWQTWMTNSMNQSDKYVWSYSERYCWTGTGYPATVVPSDILTATQNAMDAANP